MRVQQTPASASNSSYEFDIEDFAAKIFDDPPKSFLRIRAIFENLKKFKKIKNFF